MNTSHRPYARTVRAALAALVAAGACSTVASGALAPRSPLASIQDDRLGGAYVDADPDARMAQLKSLGVDAVRVDLRWDLVARSAPADGTNPADPAYDWSWYDRVVSAAQAHGIQLLFTVWGTPDWAADPAVPIDKRFGSISRRPRNAADYGAFATALGRRYSSRGVRLWEAWNEPNLPLFLRPQFVKKGKSWSNASVATYSALASAFYRGMKSADPAATVAGVVTSPAGDTCPKSCPAGANSRTAPLTFLTALGQPGRRPPMDAVSHHPYPVSLPRTKTPPTASYVDIYNVDDLVRGVDRSYLKGKPIWLTEIGFATEPVENYKKVIVSRPVQANLLSDAYVRTRLNSRVHMLTWYHLQDGQDWRSGLYDQRGTPKPASVAFKIPFHPAARLVRRGKSVLLLGQVRITDGTTTVRIEQRVGARYALVKSVPTGPDGSFQLRVTPRKSAIYRVTWTPAGGPRLVSGQVSVTVK